MVVALFCMFKLRCTFPLPPAPWKHPEKHLLWVSAGQLNLGVGCCCRRSIEMEKEESTCGYCEVGIIMAWTYCRGWRHLCWMLLLYFISICSCFPMSSFLNSICCFPLFCSQIAFISDVSFCLPRLNKVKAKLCSFSGYFSGPQQSYRTAPSGDSLTLHLVCTSDQCSMSMEVLNWLKQAHAFFSAL